MSKVGVFQSDLIIFANPMESLITTNIQLVRKKYISRRVSCMIDY